jgi:hypothetical protein
MQAEISINFRETPAQTPGFISPVAHMPAGRRPEHAPSSAAGQGLFFSTAPNTYFGRA